MRKPRSPQPSTRIVTLQADVAARLFDAAPIGGWQFVDGNGSLHTFTLTGPVLAAGTPQALAALRAGFARRNPMEVLATADRAPAWVAVLNVGLAVGSRVVATDKEILRAVHEIRHSQGALPDSTIYAGGGIYTYDSGPLAGQSFEEPCVVLSILATDDIEVFDPQMIDLAKQLAKRFRQESVIYDLQRNRSTILVTKVRPGRDAAKVFTDRIREIHRIVRAVTARTRPGTFRIR